MSSPEALAAAAEGSALALRRLAMLEEQRIRLVAEAIERAPADRAMLLRLARLPEWAAPPSAEPLPSADARAALELARGALLEAYPDHPANNPSPVARQAWRAITEVLNG